MKISLLILAIILTVNACTEPEKPADNTLYVGTYTNGTSEGIYRYKFNRTSGELTEKTLVAKIENPSFVQVSADQQYLYAVQETDSYDAEGGAVSAFAIGDNSLQLLNTKGSGGAHPCHIALSEDGKSVAVSNYTGGNLALFTTAENGELNEEKQLINHRLLDTSRTPHVHMAKFVEDAVFTADLGLDAIKKYNKKDKAYVLDEEGSLALEKGAGPRHFVFSANQQFLYVINDYAF